MLYQRSDQMKNDGVSVTDVVEFLNSNKPAAELIGVLQAKFSPDCATDADIAFALGELHGRCSGILDAAAQLAGPRGTEQIQALLPSEIPPVNCHELSGLLEVLSALATSGTLHRFRRCALPSCDRWMFVKREDQQFHTECREKHFRENCHAKERRKEYNRYKYQMELSSAWRYVPAGERPTFEQWIQHNEPHPLTWKAIKRRTTASA